MSRAARSVWVTGFYPLISGIALVIAPDPILRLAQLDPVPGPWLRLLGVVAVTVGLYYLAGARSESRLFFRASVAGRSLVVLVTLILVVAIGPWQLLLFVPGDLAGAIWTALALRADSRDRTAGTQAPT